MDKNTLSNYGWIVIAVLVLSVMIALATPFGSYIKTGVENTTIGLFETENNALITAMKASGYDPDLNHTGTIPKGGIYKKSDGTILNEGESFPKTPQINDTYEYGDYKYSFNVSYIISDDNDNVAVTMVIDKEQNGWHVKVIDKTKQEYGKMLESIAGKYVVNAFATFHNCTEMTISPIIPWRIKNISALYMNCVNLTTVAQIGHLQVDAMASTFNGCKSIKTYLGAPSNIEDGDFSQYNLPKNIKNMRSAFLNSSIKYAPTIPSSVTNVYCTFSNCYNLTGTIIVNTNPLYYDFFISSDNTGKDIVLSGTTTLKQELANTSTGNFRNVYDADGNILS